VEYEKSMGFRRAAYPAALEAHFTSIHPDFWSWEQSKRRLGIGLGIVTATLTSLALFYLFGIVLHTGGYIGTGYGILILVAFILPIALINRRGAEHFKAQWQEQGKGPQPTPIGQNVAQPSLLTVSSDLSILNLANELAVKLELPNLTFSSLQRQSTLPVGRYIGPMPGDSPIFRDQTIYLSPNIQDRLSTDDLKPLIAAALINYQGLKSRKMRSVLTLTLPTVALYIIAWFVLPPLFPTTTSCANGQCAINNLAWDVLIILLPFLAVGLIVGNVLSMRKFKWIADRETAALFGKDQLIAALRRVSEVSPSDDWNVQQRISKLA
jgi:hypothetical protein